MLRPLILPGILSLALSLPLSLPAAAQTVAFGGARADITAPVEVTADFLRVDQGTGKAVFTGNVLIGQGEMRISAESVAVDYAEGGQQRIQTLHATGGVTLVSGPDAAEAAEAVYDVAAGMITLTGDAILARGDSVLAGDRIEVNLKDGSASAAGRVRTVLQPGDN